MSLEFGNEIDRAKRTHLLWLDKRCRRVGGRTIKYLMQQIRDKNFMAPSLAERKLLTQLEFHGFIQSGAMGRGKILTELGKLGLKQLEQGEVQSAD